MITCFAVVLIIIQQILHLMDGRHEDMELFLPDVQLLIELDLPILKLLLLLSECFYPGFTRLSLASASYSIRFFRTLLASARSALVPSISPLASVIPDSTFWCSNS